MRRPAAVGAAPLLTMALLAGPVIAGLAGTLLPASGYLPALGGAGFSLDPWRDLFAAPGLGRSVALSLGTGIAATALALGAVVLIAASFQGTRGFRAIERLLSPLLSVPHAAAAFGLAFLIAPSGWIARALSPWATGWDTPPDWLIVQDPWGLSLIAGLVVKEIPFLMLMTLGALPQADAARSRATALALGYGPVTAWVKCVLPRVYPQIRLPVYAVLAYSLSVVDVAMILGPTTPPPLAVRLVAWMRDPDLTRWFTAAAGAVLQLGLVLGALAAWRGAELAAAGFGRAWAFGGGRGRADGACRALGGVVAVLATLPVLLGLAGLAVWSVAGLWAFPDALPSTITARVWNRAGPTLAGPVGASLALGVAAALIALALVLGCLETATRSGAAARRPAPRLIYLPLLAPQVAFLFGLQIFGTILRLDSWAAGVLLAHLVFVLPYVYLSLADPWAALDPRYGVVAASLGASPRRIFWAVRLPMLMAPVLTAAAVGFAVSIGLYLPTLLVGGGRVATLTTEAVALAAGGDRRLIGVYALLQMAAPFAGFALALALPALVWRNRRSMRARG